MLSGVVRARNHITELTETYNALLVETRLIYSAPHGIVERGSKTERPQPAAVALVTMRTGTGFP